MAEPMSPGEMIARVRWGGIVGVKRMGYGIWWFSVLELGRWGREVLLEGFSTR